MLLPEDERARAAKQFKEDGDYLRASFMQEAFDELAEIKQSQNNFHLTEAVAQYCPNLLAVPPKVNQSQE